MSLVWIISLLWIAAYAITQVLFTRWAYRKQDPSGPIEHQATVDVILCARNEEAIIGRCLQSLLSQEVNKVHYQVRVYDDHSSDLTPDIITGFDDPRLIYYRADAFSAMAGKKSAIAKIVADSDSDIILMADADCIYPSDWLRSMAGALKGEVSMVAGPVSIMGTRKLLYAFQGYLFAGIQTWVHAGINKNFFYMPSGASLGFRRSAFEKVGGYEGNEHVSSGDDVFLAMKMHDSGLDIRSSMKWNALVQSMPCLSWGELIDQYARWASKTGSYRYDFSVLIWLFMVATNIGLLGVLIGSFILPVLYPLWVYLLIVKFLADLYTLHNWYRYFKLRLSFNRVLLSVLLLPVFLIILMLRVIFSGNLTWKGRQISS